MEPSRYNASNKPVSGQHFHIKALSISQYDSKIEKLIPFSLYLAHSALSIFKIALKMLCKIASQKVHSENESCFSRTAVMTVFSF